MATTIAADLTAWTRLLAFTGDAKALAGCEPKGAALPAPARPGPAHPQCPPTTTPDPRNLALGCCDRRGVRHHRRHPTTSLTIRPPTT